MTTFEFLRLLTSGKGVNSEGPGYQREMRNSLYFTTKWGTSDWQAVLVSCQWRKTGKTGRTEIFDTPGWKRGKKGMMVSYGTVLYVL